MRLTLFLLIILTGCNQSTKTELPATKINPEQLTALNAHRPDIFSFSRHDEVKMTHLNLNLEVNFKRQILEGYAIIDYQVIKPEAKRLVLDSRGLKIKRVESLHDSKNNKLLWRKGDSIAGLGTELIIDLPTDHTAIKIHYQTMPEASGLQWLEPEKTSGKKSPYLFSQSQAIHARSWIPIQDTPSVRVTYDATMHVKPGLRVVMSADNNNQQANDGVHTFSMRQAIPAYLIAIAVGDIELQKISEHVTIYAEQDVLEAAAYEFAATEEMISATEAIYGPYLWGQYDLLILPPSFPFGGMENPKLSHITPTVIAGDRSLDSLIAHELAHSWSGNLVTNAKWQDAWLNEGFTSYIESRIVEAIYGKARMMMESTLVYQALISDMQKMDVDMQKLVNPTHSNDPDDYFSSVSYDKGRFFLEWMEQQVGRKTFDQFLNQYFSDHAFKSITTQDFVKYLQDNLIKPHSEKINLTQINKWLYEPGMPSFFKPPTTQRFDVIIQTANNWITGRISTEEIETDEWTTQEWLHFLRALPKKLSFEQMQALDSQFNLTQRQNSEVAHDWLLITINNQYQPAYERLIDYLTSIGRVKLIKPLYEAMMGHENLQNFARQIYQKARAGYHNIATQQLDQIIHIDEEN
jgi:leukotriene-A4 hydrolase